MAEFIKLITENDIWKCAAEFMKKFWVVLLVFIIALSVRVLYINQKSGLHIDESLSYIISSRNTNALASKFFSSNKSYTGDEILQITIGNPRSFKDVVKDIAAMYIDNKDHSWTNLYYSALRLTSAFTEDYSLKSLIARGCSLNLIFFTLSFFYFFKLLQILFKGEDKNIYIPFALFVAYMNTGSITNTVFIRSYQLQEAMLVILTYIFARFYTDITAGKFHLPAKKFFITAFVMSLVSLSGYFCLIYEVLLGSVLVYLCIRKKYFEDAKTLVALFVANIIFANLLYLGFRFGFGSSRAIAIYKIGSGLFANLKMSALQFVIILQKFLFYPAIIILTFISAFRLKKQDTNYLLLTISLCTLVWSAVVMVLAPYKVVRYIMAGFPLLSLIIPYLTQRANFKLSYLFVFLYLSYSMFPLMNIPDIQPKLLKKIIFASKIENLYKNNDKYFVFRYKPEMPVFISEGDVWTTAILYPYLNPHQNYKFVDFSFLEQKLYPKNCFIIYPHDKFLPQEDTLHELYCGGYYKCFEITD